MSRSPLLSKYPGAARSHPGFRKTLNRTLQDCRTLWRLTHLKLLLVLLLAVFVAAYAASLFAVADPHLYKNVSRGSYTLPAYSMLLAVAVGTTAGWLATLALSRAAAARVWPALLAVLLLFLALRHGASFKDHGLFNLVGFLFLFLPLNTVCLAVWALWKAAGRRRFPRALAAVLLTAALVLAVKLAHARRQWGLGFYGRSIDESPPYCNFPPNLPWIDLLPAGAINFWAPNRCKAVTSFDATFRQEDGLLTISGCAPGKVVEYTPLPRAHWWASKRRSLSGMTKALRELMKAKPYVGPVQLTSTEAVLARCGSEERLLVRVAAKVPAAMQAAKTHTSSAANSSDATGRAPASGRWGEQQAGAVPGNITASTGATASISPGSHARPRGGPAGPKGGPSSDSRSVPEDQPLNVLVIFLDSLQRRRFFRRLPKTVAALEGLPAASGDVTSLYQFFRHHIVGINTAYNTFAAFTGNSFRWDGKHDGAKPIWESYGRRGYKLGTACNLCQDWGKHHINKPLRISHELITPFCLPEYQPPGGEESGLLQGAYSIRARCMYGRPVHQYSLEYNTAFMEAFDGVKPWFFVNTFHEGHEPTGEVVATMDADLASFLQSLSPTLLNRTAVLLYGDHGLHMGLNFLFTKNGAVEHANPFLALLLPSWLKQRHPAAAAALAANEQSLITGFDIFTTLHHLLHLHESKASSNGTQGSEVWAAPGKKTLKAWAKAGGVKQKPQWGLSLLGPMPAGRSCEDAGVPPQWCMCHHSIRRH